MTSCIPTDQSNPCPCDTCSGYCACNIDGHHPTGQSCGHTKCERCGMCKDSLGYEVVCNGSSTYQSNHPEPQPNTDSLEGFTTELRQILQTLKEDADEQEGLNQFEIDYTAEAVEKLFNKYAREREREGQIVELTNQVLLFENQRLEAKRRLQKLQEQRAKLKENNNE